MNRCSPSACISRRTLASAGHNHVIASHALTGSDLRFPRTSMRTSFEAHIPWPRFTVDNAALSRAGAQRRFPRPRCRTAPREGTRRNMLGGRWLDMSATAQIVLRSVAARVWPGSRGGHRDAKPAARSRAVLDPGADTVRRAVLTISVPCR